MRLILYIFFIFQLLNFLHVFAEKKKEESSNLSSVKWEKVEEKSQPLKKIIWRSYNNDESYFENKNNQSGTNHKTNSFEKEKINKLLKKSVFSNYGKYFTSENEREKFISNGGITVNNALIPKAGTSQIKFNYDSKGNLFGSYGYSLSNIFQLELLNIGSFNDLNFGGSKNSNLYSTYLGENNLNFRIGGKVLIFSSQKDNFYSLSLRSSIGKNDDTNKGYLFTEFLNTFRVNNWLAFNISPKYFSSGVESFGGIGFSSYINLSDNLMLIPEINSSIRNDSDLNSTLALRYLFSPKKSLDLYYSNASGIQDIGQLLKDKEYRFGIKLNFLY